MNDQLVVKHGEKARLESSQAFVLVGRPEGPSTADTI